MSVEITGPKGYEYQYLVTTYIALTILNKPLCSVLVEKINGEDAEIVIQEDGLQKIIEVQVKRQQGDLGKETLVEWLCHFADGSSNNNLIHRLSQDFSRLVLFVTRSRCLDNTREFIAQEVLKAHERSVLKRGETTDQFLECFKHVFSKNGSPLEVNRASFCIQQSNAFLAKKSEIQEVAKRVLIWEQRGEEAIKDCIRRLLTKTYLIPPSMTDNVLRLFDEAVRTARDVRGDVIPRMKDILKQFEGNRIFNSSIHVARPETEKLTETLETTNVLLLTGMSFCGKTHLARYVAQLYQNNGFECLESNELREVDRFLRGATEDRLCVLQDPFGHMVVHEHSPELWRGLTDLISSLPSQCKLIVTSKNDLLRDVTNEDREDEWEICGHQWHDLTVRNPAWLKRFWGDYCVNRGVTDQVRQIVDVGMSEQDYNELLQPGQLRHLAFEQMQKLEEKEFQALLVLARIDAKELGKIFARRGAEFQKLYITLALGATTLTSIKFAEIQYMLSNSKQRPGHGGSEFQAIEFPGRETAPDFPIYEELLPLPVNLRDEIRQLETRGYITVSDGGIRFTHPTYEEAFRYVLFSQKPSGVWIIEDILDKGLACLSPQTAFQVSKHLGKLYSMYYRIPEFQETVLVQALSALRSIFPVVRDSALSFLITRLEDVDKDVQEKIIEAIERSSNENLNIYWHQGQPWIDMSDEQSFLYWYEMRITSRSNEQLGVITEQLLNDQTATFVSAEDAWQLLLAPKDFFSSQEQDRIVHLRLMQFNESLIREKAAYHLLESYANYPDILELVFHDDHPHVIYQAILGCFNGWQGYSSVVRAQLVDYMKKAMEQKGVAVATSRFMSGFVNQEHSEYIYEWEEMGEEERSELWVVWAELFPNFINHIPTAFIRIDQANLYTTAQNSVKYLESQQVIRVADAWLCWIERRLSSGLPDEYGLSVARYALNVAGNEAELRNELSTKLLSHPDTNFLIVTLAAYVDNWGNLVLSERDMVLQLLDGDRFDRRWLRAVALTRSVVPSAIQEVITGNGNMLSLSNEEIISQCPIQLLKDCVHVYSGHPQPLWYLGTHHAMDAVWGKVISDLMYHPDHSAFALALREKMRESLYEKGDFLVQWDKLCNNSNISLENALFECLLKSTARDAGYYCEPYWEAFFNGVSKEAEEEYLERIIAVIESVSWCHEEIWDVFGRDRFINKILPRLQSDKVVFNLFSKKTKLNQDLSSIDLSILQKLFESNPPRLLICHKMAIKLCKEVVLGESAIIIEEIEQSRKLVIDKGRQQRGHFDDDDFPLENWNDTYLKYWNS